MSALFGGGGVQLLEAQFDGPKSAINGR